MFANQIVFVDPRHVVVKRDERQRKKIDTEDLEPSIKTRGIMNPIIVKHEGSTVVLVAGERRLTAALNLGLREVPIRFFEDLDPTEAKIIEFEENAKRRDLTWQERALAIHEIHKDLLSKNSAHTINATAHLIGYVYKTAYCYLTVAEEHLEGDARVFTHSSAESAYSYVQAKNERKMEAAEASLHEELLDNFGPIELEEPDAESFDMDAEEIRAVVGATPPAPSPSQAAPAPAPAPTSFLNADFVEWADSYTGVPFNFLHCDFPYGIDLQDSEFAHTEGLGSYQDSSDVFWSLCAALCRNLDKIMSSSAHMIFWFSMGSDKKTGEDYYTSILDFFGREAPSLSFIRRPLTWHKTDNKGIMADNQRQFRNVTEHAFLVSRGDRKLVKGVSNAYGAPTDRVIHQAAKPVPVLNYFFSAIVDENTRMLDPTSGSGNAIISAHGLGASKVLGIERDPEFYSRSVEAFRKYTILKNLNKDTSHD